MSYTNQLKKQPDHNDEFIINAIRNNDDLGRYGITETSQYEITSDIDKVNALTGEVILSPHCGPIPKASVRSTWIVDGVPHFLLSIMTLRNKDFRAVSNPIQADELAPPSLEASQEESASHTNEGCIPQTTIQESPNQLEHMPQASCQSASGDSI